jgi:hypothetical protein
MESEPGASGFTRDGIMSIGFVNLRRLGHRRSSRQDYRPPLQGPEVASGNGEITRQQQRRPRKQLAGRGSITLYCLGRLDLGEIAVEVNRMTTVEQLTLHLHHLGYLESAHPLTDWHTLQPRTGCYIRRDMTVGDTSIRYGDLLYWRNAKQACRNGDELDGAKGDRS